MCMNHVLLSVKNRCQSAHESFSLHTQYFKVFNVQFYDVVSFRKTLSPFPFSSIPVYLFVSFLHLNLCAHTEIYLLQTHSQDGSSKKKK